MRRFPEGAVPSFEQSTAQHKRAAATAGVWLCLRAALQHSMSPIAPPMLHESSLECRGMPAKALPASTSNSTKDVSRFLIVANHCRENIQSLSSLVGPASTVLSPSATGAPQVIDKEGKPGLAYFHPRGVGDNLTYEGCRIISNSAFFFPTIDNS